MNEIRFYCTVQDARTQLKINFLLTSLAGYFMPDVRLKNYIDKVKKIGCEG